ncbi:hypothetical protein RO3G_07554 [Rhizopus delemar RA 99-880]|uniref:Uncharacterized protein n=1 Tax=Rhizopus delemar (strain RA 99-880 / ATCC MYA-4621 / FGSC 9543 / NRRL 43880) TaxID=246409 RepID=I1C319_RHIO9|nr:hypothetical protein RO3G_07554 [Rhizopus delemar RA 99-880]|eukprot:EIE82849.1 hypothetical protein RO3G_07554 [Rhizopus delemar RA 99-880]
MLKRRFKTVHPSPESTLTLEDQECFLYFHCMIVSTSLSKFMNKLAGRQPSPVLGIKKSKEISPNTDKVQNALTPKDFAEEIKNSEALVWVLIPMLRASLLQLILVLHLQRKELKRHLPMNTIICAVSILLLKNVHNKKS